MVAVTVDLEMSWSSRLTLPVTFVNSPWTLEMPRWRTENWALEWAGSSCQVVDWAWVAVAADNIALSAAAIRTFLMAGPRGAWCLEILFFFCADYSRSGLLPPRGQRKGGGHRESQRDPSVGMSRKRRPRDDEWAAH